MIAPQNTQLSSPYPAGARAGFVSRLLALAIDTTLLVVVLLVGNELWATLNGAWPVRSRGSGFRVECRRPG